MKPHVFGFALLSAIAIVASAPAQAQNGSLTRSFVSSAGVDTNACTIAAPCASFAQAYTKIGANGIIAALDPGKYGPIAITGPVTINGNGWAAITAPANGAGITITAGSGNVTLTGLEIDGAGAAYNGIVFNSGGNLVVRNCVLKDFIANGLNGQSGNGIWIAPTSGTITFTIVDTIVSNSGWAGIYYFPPSGSATATGVINHVVVTGGSSYGIGAILANAAGGSADISISNSVISNNPSDGVFAFAPLGSIAMTLDNDEISYNYFGINNVESTIVLGRSTITNNSTYGITNEGTIDTFLNNQIYANGNSNAVQGNALTPVSAQ
jgi:hypothetical protein